MLARPLAAPMALIKHCPAPVGAAGGSWLAVGLDRAAKRCHDDVDDGRRLVGGCAQAAGALGWWPAALGSGWMRAGRRPDLVWVWAGGGRPDKQTTNKQTNAHTHAGARAPAARTPILSRRRPAGGRPQSVNQVGRSRYKVAPLSGAAHLGGWGRHAGAGPRAPRRSDKRTRAGRLIWAGWAGPGRTRSPERAP